MKTQMFIGITLIFTILVGLPFGSAQVIDISTITDEEEVGNIVQVPDDFERLVRLVYFIPNDRKPQPGINSKLDELIKKIHQLFTDRMEQHGYGRKTFTFEADANGKAIIHHVNGRFDDTYYQINPTNKINSELQEQFDNYHNGVYLIVVEISSDTFNDGGACGLGAGSGFGGHAYIPASGHCFEDYTNAAHELGHAFALPHDFRNSDYIMSYGSIRNQLSNCAAIRLNVHPYFNPDKAFTRSRNTRINLLSSKFDATPPYALRLRFEINDPDGLVQAQLLTNTTGDSDTIGDIDIATCKALRGVSENVELVTTKFFNNAYLEVIDTHGNSVEKRLYIDFTALTPNTITVVHIPDPGLDTAIRKHFDYPPKKQITSFDMARIPYLNAESYGISDLTGLEHAVVMEYLNISQNNVQDITPILALPELRKIDITLNPIKDLTQVAELTQLTTLIAGGSQSLDDIKLLKELLPLTNPSANIKNLPVITPLVDITPLAKLTNLTELIIQGNQISDLTPLSNLTQLQTLFLANNQITDVTPLANLTQLIWLTLNHNQIRDIMPLKNMTRLTSLNLQFNQIVDITPLTKSTQLQNLGLAKNQITNTRPLTQLVNLKRLEIYGNPITDLQPLLTLKRRAPKIKIYHTREDKSLPVTLSSFKATRTSEGAIIKWTTESEVDNAGFNIHRSLTKIGEFQKINVKLIQGAGTTGERSTYGWTDTTAKPNTVYYYQIEDVSHAGERQRLATVRLRGLVSASGKLMSRWADLKR